MTQRPPAPLPFIRSFEAAARHLSFTRAAGELGLTQAAVSTHVRGLEKYLGRRLFTRNARSLALTEIGEAFLPTLRQALGQIDAATGAIARQTPDDSVLLSCPVSLAQGWLPQVLRRFQATHPSVEVILHGTVWDRGGEDGSDIALSIHREDEAPRHLRRLLPQTLRLVATPTLVTPGDPARMLALPRIDVAGRQDLFPLVEAALGRKPAETPARLRSNSSNLALDLAAAGLGATVALSTLAQPYLARGALAALPGLDLPSPWHYYLAPPPARPTAPVRALLALIEAEASAINRTAIPG